MHQTSNNLGLTIFSILLPILIFSSCSTSNNVVEPDLNSLDLDVELADENSSYHTITLSGFTLVNPNQYDKALHKLENHYPEDVTDIGRNSDQITATIKDDPISYNRVLWSLGSEHFKKHSTDYESPEPTGTGRDEMPELIGGINALMSEVRYPAGLNGIEGRVMVEFIVSRFGEVEEPFVTRSLHSAADREAIRAVKEMKFKPGIIDGVPVKVKYTLPVFFRAP
ncbi:MAG: energy transducer TonB [Rhodohalobacter sp.]|nr:energy transducer TonB [Rhodohalobacter sp.]